MKAVGDVDVGLGQAVGAEHEREDIDEGEVVEMAIGLDERVKAFDLLDLGPALGIGRARDVGDPGLRQGGRRAWR